MYNALSHPVDELVGDKPNLTVYTNYQNLFPQESQKVTLTTEEIVAHYGSSVTIAYTTMGFHDPLRDTPRILILHGVPTRKEQWYPVQKLLSMFAYTVSFDMLGMGESDKLLLSDYTEQWKWKYDSLYIRELAKHVFGRSPDGDGPNKFIFISDDWGSGIHIHYASLHPRDIEKNVLLDPIAFDGYPVKEIEAIGRTAPLPESTFRMALGAFDQTLVQILKTMTFDPNVWNQWNQRPILSTYTDVDYARKGIVESKRVLTELDAVMNPSRFATVRGATPLTMNLNFRAIRVLAQRSSILSPALLLPFHADLNPEGVNYSEITGDTLVLWGDKDNMMPTNQLHRFRLALTHANVRTQKIPNAGHFAGVDQPELVAEAIMDFLSEKVSDRLRLNDLYIGFTGIWKGDENLMLTDLRSVYNMPRSHRSFERIVGIKYSSSKKDKSFTTTQEQKMTGKKKNDASGEGIENIGLYSTSDKKTKTTPVGTKKATFE